MSYLFKGALPFTLALFVGVMLSAILGTSNLASWTNQSRTRRLFIPMENRDPFRRGWMRRGCEFNKSVEFAGIDPDRNASSTTTPGHVISYSNGAAIDGQPVTRNAVIINLPTPRFWTIDVGLEPASFDLTLRVTLNSTGKVGEVENLAGSMDTIVAGGRETTYQPPHLEDDVMAAARAIQFRPAMRGSVPVSQRIIVRYRQQ
jgi:hypothetical protein